MYLIPIINKKILYFYFENWEMASSCDTREMMRIFEEKQFLSFQHISPLTKHLHIDWRKGQSFCKLSFFVTLKHFLSLISSSNFMTNSSKKRKLSFFLSTKRILLNFILLSQMCVYYVHIYSCNTFVQHKLIKFGWASIFQNYFILYKYFIQIYSNISYIFFTAFK